MPGARALVLVLVHAAASLTAATAATSTLTVAFADQEGQVVARKAPAARPNYMVSSKMPQRRRNEADLNPHGEPLSETVVARRRRKLQSPVYCGPTTSSYTNPPVTVTPAPTFGPSRSTPSPVATPRTRAPVPAPTTPPASPETPAPVTPPTAPPVSPPTSVPVSPPTPAYVSPPTPAPVTPPTPAPVSPPTPAPVTPPTSAPVAPPTPAPVSPPTPAPVTPPTSSPVSPPTPTPITPPTPAPITPPTPAPVTPPTSAPITPPTPAPVTPPTPAPVSPPTPAPVEAPVGTSDCNGDNPCMNGGSCAADPAGGYFCTCAQGYAGMTCQTATDDLPAWTIELTFEGDAFTTSRQEVFQRAADRWSEVISHVPGGGAPNWPAGSLVISAALTSIDGPGGILGSAGPTGVWADYPGISYSGAMDFDSSDIANMEADGSFEGVITHEMGHVLGVGTLWDACSTCRTTNSAAWTCPAGQEAYRQLSDTDGDADIIELDGGTGTACGHFSEATFDDEIMTGFVTRAAMPLSKLTVASLEDIGYVVDPSRADEYMIPAKRGLAARSEEEEEKIQLNDEMGWTTMNVLHSDGRLTTMDAEVRVRF